MIKVIYDVERDPLVLTIRGVIISFRLIKGLSLIFQYLLYLGYFLFMQIGIVSHSSIKQYKNAEKFYE